MFLTLEITDYSGLFSDNPCYLHPFYSFHFCGYCDTIIWELVLRKLQTLKSLCKSCPEEGIFMKIKSISNLELPNFGQFYFQHVLMLRICTILFFSIFFAEPLTALWYYLCLFSWLWSLRVFDVTWIFCVEFCFIWRSTIFLKSDSSFQILFLSLFQPSSWDL